jgi:hypothetical protein
MALTHSMRGAQIASAMPLPHQWRKVSNVCVTMDSKLRGKYTRSILSSFNDRVNEVRQHKIGEEGFKFAFKLFSLLRRVGMDGPTQIKKSIYKPRATVQNFTLAILLIPVSSRVALKSNPSPRQSFLQHPVEVIFCRLPIVGDSML